MSMHETPQFRDEKGMRSEAREGVRRWARSHDEIRRLDPLGRNNFFEKQLPRLNLYEDVDGLVYAARDMLPTREDLDSYSIPRARAVKRDLGFVATSILHQNGQLESVPGLKDRMVELAGRTGDTPSHTIFDYISYNPQGEEMRTFTGTDRERIIIEQTDLGMRSLPNCILRLDEASETNIFDPEYARLVRGAATDASTMKKSIAEVMRNEGLIRYFVDGIQPYFMNKITIGETRYGGAGGAQVPIFMVDRLVGSSPKKTDAEKSEYEEYYADNIQYSPKELRDLNKFFDKRPLLDAALEDSENVMNRKSSEEIGVAHASVRALGRLIKELKGFRNPHTTVVRNSMEMRQIKEGSGGYDEEMVGTLKDSTAEARRRIDKVADNLNIPHWRDTFQSS